MSNWLDAHELAFYVVTSWVSFFLFVVFAWAWWRMRADRDRAQDATAKAMRELATLRGARTFRRDSPPADHP